MSFEFIALLVSSASDFHLETFFSAKLICNLNQQLIVQSFPFTQGLSSLNVTHSYCYTAHTDKKVTHCRYEPFSPLLRFLPISQTNSNNISLLLLSLSIGVVF